MVIHCQYTRLVPLQELKSRFHPKNPNKHSEDQIKRLAQILRYQGVRYPIKLSKRSNLITSGHGRVLAMELNHKQFPEEKWNEIPVSDQDYQDDDQEFADVVSDNSIAEWAELDLAVVNDQLKNFDPNFDIDLLGLKDFEIEVADKFNSDPDEVPEVPVTPKTKLGDLYILGNHRVLCGDSTKIEDVEKLMGQDRVDLLWTDPPYGVSYTEKNEWLNSIGTGHRLTNAIENDSKSPEEMNEFWFKSLLNAHSVMTDKSSYYIASPQGGDLMMMMMMSIKRAGFQLKHSLVWVKNNHVLGRCDYNYKHEPLLYGWKQDCTHNFYGEGRCKTSVWDFNKPLKNDLHPTMKPIELIKEALLNSTKKEDIVMDLFLGSGSTLIASEESKRKCYGLELMPNYCDVIVSRYCNFVGSNKINLNGQDIEWQQ